MEGGRRGGIRCRWRWSERWLLAMIVWIEERVEREMPIQSMCARVERQANLDKRRKDQALHAHNRSFALRVMTLKEQ